MPGGDEASALADLHGMRLDYDLALPVSAERARILAALRTHQVLVLSGDTGSGKTTQLPKLCVEAGGGSRGLIGHTQPRRIAAHAVAERLAEETGTTPGDVIGCKVRFDDRTGPRTRIKVMTDGILLAEITRDRELRAYDTLIIDEAHERSLNIDFLLGYLHRLLPRRPDLRVIITSATIDTGRFARHFDDAPVIEVSGRTFPVSVEYRPADDPDEDLASQVATVVQALSRRPLDDLGGGVERDMLVFLPGQADIRETTEALSRLKLPDFEVLPLYARLPAEQQARIFHPGPRHRIVLATNVAETSLTVPRIRFVIDTGLARVSRYSPRAKVQRLPIEPVSQAAADQRKGRCGRIAPGLCVRLYAEEDYAARPAYTDSEILRTNLASVILQMAALRLGSPEDFPFLEPPPESAIRDGFQLLEELQAVDARGRITRLGHTMARLQVEPRFARMLVAADREGALADVLVIVSALSIQDPRERPPDRQQAADEAHRKFADPRSDFLVFLKLWRDIDAVRRDGGSGGLRRYCREHFLSWRRVREWQEVHRQLQRQCRTLKLRAGKEGADAGRIHRALLTGLLSLVARRDERREYRGARDTRVTLFPGSGLVQKPPPWLMAAGFMQTSRTFAMTAARVRPGWIEAAAAHLVRRTHGAPWFDRAQGRVMCEERVTLWGLELVAGRTVALAPHDRAAARMTFIEQALVDTRLRRAPPAVRANWRLRRRLESLEARIRRRDLVAGARVQAAFYDERLPADVVDARTLDTWLQTDPATDARLRMSRDTLLLREPSEITPERYPDALEIGENRLTIRYRFEPGAVDDGLTLTVPAPLLAGVSPARLTWLVPGYLPERIDLLLRALPKPDRRRLVPVPDTARRLAGDAPWPPPDAHSIETWLAGELEARYSVRVEPRGWADVLPPELHFNVRVVDLDGRLLGQGRDLQALRTAHGGAAPAKLPGLEEHEREGIKLWDFAELGGPVDLERGGIVARLYPALVDTGNAVDLRLLDSAASAARETRHGVLRLAMLAMPQQVRELERAVAADTRLLFAYRHVGDRRALQRDLLWATFEEAMLQADTPVPRTRVDFDAMLARGRASIMPTGERLLALARTAFGKHATLLQHLDAQPLPDAVAADLRRQLSDLVGDNTLARTPREWREHLPRYLDAVEVRLDKLRHGHARDTEYTEMMVALRDRLDDWIARRPGDALPPALVEYRWLLEELRVSLFAQALGTARKVSRHRLDAHWSRATATAVARA